ncbi:MAG: glycosyltransferase [Bacteroidia bacterium]
METVVREWFRFGNNMEGFVVNVVSMDSASMASNVKGVYSYRFLKFFHQPLSFGYLKTLWYKRCQYQIYHLHLPNFLAIICLLFIPRTKTIVLHWHADIVKITGKFLFRPLEKWAVKRATKVIYTSNSYYKSSYSHKWSNEKKVILPLLCEKNTNSFSIEKKYKGKILFVGRFVDYKGFKPLMNTVLKNGWEDKFIFLGGESRDFNQEYWKSSIYKDLDVKFNISNKSLALYFAESKFVILPSINRAEAFGIVAIEGLSSGSPLLTSDLMGSGLKEVNREGICGLKFETGNIESMQEAIKQAMKISLFEYERLSKNAYKIWQEHYDIRKLKNHLTEVYKLKV